MQMTCPHCSLKLRRSDQPPYLLWVCDRCRGCAVTMANLRKGIQHEALRKAWNRTIGENRRALLPCPACTATLYRVPITGPEVDLCRQCQVLWLDAGELEELPARSDADRRADVWAEELDAMRRRRATCDFYTRLIRRNVSGA